MNEWYGLGIALELRDNMSQGLETARSSFDRFKSDTERGVNDVEKQIQRLNNLQITGALMSNTGSMVQGMGTSLLKPVVNLGKEVISTGSQFENWRMTLKALYKDADVATQKLQWGMNLAAKTPFEMKDVTSALIGFKAVGADADKMFTNANGQAKSFLEYMGDLAALRPDVGLQGVMLGVRNLLGGDGGKSLKMRMDMDFENIIGKKWGTTTDEIMQDLVTASDKIAGGLMTNLEGTWGQIVSNLKDQSQRFFLAVADNGAFDTFKKSIKGIADIINGLDDDQLKTIGTHVSEAINMIMKPVQWVIKGFEQLLKVIIKLASSDSTFAKLVLGVMSFVGVGLLAVGTVLKLSGGFIQTISSLGIFIMMMSQTNGVLSGVGLAFKSLASKILPLALVVGAVALAWQTDFLGLRTHVLEFAETCKTAWADASNYAHMGAEEMSSALSTLDTTNFGGWLTYRLTQLQVLWLALVDVWNDNELSTDNLQKVQELGLMPIINFVVETKDKVLAMFEGLGKGFGKVYGVLEKVVSKVLEWGEQLVTFLFPVKEGVEGVSDSLKSVDTQKWEKFGETTAYIISILGGLWVFGKIASVISAVGGGIVSLGGLIVSIVSGVINFVGFLAGCVGTALGAIGTLVTAILGVFGIVVTAPAWVVGAITLAIAGIVALVIAYWDEIKQFCSELWQSIVEGWEWLKQSVCDIFSAIGEWFKEKWEGIKQFASETWQSISETASAIWEPIASGFQWLWDSVCEGAEWLWNGIKAGIDRVATFFEGLFEIIEGICQIGWSIIYNGAVIAWNVIKFVVLLAWEGIKWGAEQVWNGIQVIWEGAVSFFQWVWEGILSVVQPIWDAISSACSTACEYITQAWQSFCDFFQAIWDWLYNSVILPIWDGIVNYITTCKDIVVTTWESLVDFFTQLWDTIYNGVIVPIWDGIVSAIQTAYDTVCAVWDAIVGFFQGVWDAVYNNVIVPVWNSITSTTETAYNTVCSVWDAIVGFFQGIWETVKSVCQSAWESIKSYASSAKDFVVNIWNAIVGFFSNLWNTIKNLASQCWEWIKSVASSAVDRVKSVWGSVTGFFSGVWNGIKSSASALFDWLAGKFQWVSDIIQNISNAWGNIKEGVSGGWEKIKSGAKKMVGLNTGGYVKTTGIAMLHPNEVVVNDDLTQRLRSFLNDSERGSVVTQGNVQPNVSVPQPTNNNTPQVQPTTGGKSVSNDNRITFSEGAIQINLAKGDEQDAENLVDMIMEKIEAKRQLRDVLNYA